jgi:UDP-N-acetylmuramyl pentapeptide synthase
VNYILNNFEANTAVEPWPSIGDPKEIAQITGGSWTSVPQSPISAIRHRVDLIEEGLKGFLFAPELLANSYGTKARAALFTAVQAIDMGAVGVIATMPPRNIDAGFPCLIVKDTFEALHRLARHKRATSEAKFIAVTGSVGKTTTKNMVHHLASALGPAHRSIANYNKGVESISFTLSNLADIHSFSTAEFNEVRDLEDQIRLYRPNVAIITNVLWEHIDAVERKGFGGDKAIPRLAYLAAGVAREMEAGGVCILNADEQNFDSLADEVRKSKHIALRTFGARSGNDVIINELVCDQFGSDISIAVDGRTLKYRLGLPGRHMAMNSVAAAAAARFAGMDLFRVLPSLADFQPETRRGVRTSISWGTGQIAIRDESFSSSIPSLRSSFALLEMERPASGGRRIAVLGQVGDLGLSMPSAMKELAREADKLSIDRFYTVGSDIRIFNESISDRSRVAPHFQTLAQLETALAQDLAPGDVVLLKGSDDPNRSVSLTGFVERLSTRAIAACPVPPAPLSSKRIVLGGDTYFGEYFQKKRAKISEIDYLQTFGYDYSGERIRSLFTRADFVVVNLECVLTDMKESALEGGKDRILAGRPEETTAALKNLNVGGVLLGNNHAMDYSSKGLLNTLEHLADSGIAVSGAGEGKEKAQRAMLKTLDVGGIEFKLAIVSAYEFSEPYDKLGFYAGSQSLGVNNINTTRLQHQISALRAAGYYVVVSPHWGASYCFRSQEQTRHARRIVEAGADLIIGHGPHVMNDVAQVDGVWVAYSLGNLIFNSGSEYDRRGVLPYSLIAELEFARAPTGVSGQMNLYPIVSCNHLTQFQPVFVDEQQFRQVSDVLVSTQYDQRRYLKDVAFRQRDGRHCITVKLF